MFLQRILGRGLAFSVLTLSLVLAACGGTGNGSGSSSSSSSSSTSSSSSSTSSSSTSSSSTSSSSSSSTSSSSSSSTSSSSSSSSSSTGGAAVTATSWSDDFSAADGATFFSTTYATQPSSSTALYRQSGGTSVVTGGQLTLTNSRFVVGELSNTATTASVSPGGIFNLAGKACTLVVTAASTGSGAGNFQVYVDNNTSGAANSPLGSASRVVNAAATTLVAGANNFAWSNVGTATSFLQLRAESTATIVLEGISLNCI